MGARKPRSGAMQQLAGSWCSNRHGIVPNEMLQVAERVGGSQCSHIARPKIEPENDPVAGARSLAIERGKLRLSDGIQLELDAFETGRETCAHRFGDGLLTGPQRKEAIAARNAVKTRKHLQFRRSEVAARDVEGVWWIMQPFDIDSQRLPQPHREGAAISAVRKAEVAARRAGRRAQPRPAAPDRR